MPGRRSDAPEDEDFITFRRHGAVNAIAAWSRSSAEADTEAYRVHRSPSDSPSPDQQPGTEWAPMATGACSESPPTSIPSKSQSSERRLPVTTDQTTAYRTLSHAGAEPSEPNAMPPDSSRLFHDRQDSVAHRTNSSENTSAALPAPQRLAREGSAEVDCLPEQPAEPPRCENNSLDVTRRLAQQQRERLEKLLQSRCSRHAAPSPPVRSESPQLSPLPHASPCVSRNVTEDTIDLGKESTIADRSARPSQAATPSPRRAAAARTSSIAVSCCDPPRRARSGVAVFTQTGGTDTAYWQHQLTLLAKLKRSFNASSGKAVAAHRERGTVRTPPLPPAVAALHHRDGANGCLDSRAAQWDAANSGNVLVGDDGVVAVAEASRAYAAIAQEYETSVDQAPHLAVVPMYCIGGACAPHDHLRFSVQLWTTAPAPLEALPLSHKRFAVGVASADFKGPHTASPSFLFWSDGTAVAKVGAEVAAVPFGEPYTADDEVTAVLDMQHGCLSFSVNCRDHGVAFRFAATRHPAVLLPVVVFGEDGDAATLTHVSRW